MNEKQTETLLGESELEKEEHKNVKISFLENNDSSISVEVPEDLEIVTSSTFEETSLIAFYGTIEITVLKATDLEKKDLFQKADPYVVVEFGNQISPN